MTDDDRDRRPAAGPARPRPERGATTTTSSASTTAWTASRGRSWASSSSTWRRWTEARRRLADRYRDELAGLPLKLPVEAAGRRHVWHLFVVPCTPSGTASAASWKPGVSRPGLHYPVPVHLQEAYAAPGLPAGRLPGRRAGGRECFTLPLFPEMTDEQQDRVVEALHEIFREVDRS